MTRVVEVLAGTLLGAGVGLLGGAALTGFEVSLPEEVTAVAEDIPGDTGAENELVLACTIAGALAGISIVTRRRRQEHTRFNSGGDGGGDWDGDGDGDGGGDGGD